MKNSVIFRHRFIRFLKKIRHGLTPIYTDFILIIYLSVFSVHSVAKLLLVRAF